MKNGRFTGNKTTTEIRDDYIRKSDSNAAFVMDCLESNSDCFIVKKELYNEFAEYCRGRGLPAVTQTTFYKNLLRHIAVTDFRPHVEGRRYHTFKGIRYKVDGWSNQSKRSRGFLTLSKLSDDYLSPWKIKKLEDKEYIKVVIPLTSWTRLTKIQMS